MSAKKIAFGTKPAPKETPAASADAWVESRAAAETTKRLTLDIPASLHGRIKSQCALRGEKMVDVIRELLEEYFRG